MFTFNKKPKFLIKFRFGILIFNLISTHFKKYGQNYKIRQIIDSSLAKQKNSSYTNSKNVTFSSEFTPRSRDHTAHSVRFFVPAKSQRYWQEIMYIRYRVAFIFLGEARITVYFHSM